MDLNPIVLSIPIYFVLIGIELIYDRIKHKKLYRLNDAITNISCGITEQVTGVFVKVLTVAVYVFFYEYFRIFEVPHTWYWAVVLFIGVDFFYYWAHRYSHEINLFWTGHVIHHQSEDYNFSVALRQGVFQKVFTAFFFIPLAIVGFDPEWFVYIGAFSTLYQFWIHTEAIDKMGWFGYLFNTPSHHRVHHGVNPKYIDKNHGGTFIIFDRMFGTFQAEEERPTYGVTTPVNSFDPITAHVTPFMGIWKDLKQVKGLKNKLLLLIKPPGWLPKENGGFRVPQPVNPKTYHKYDQPTEKRLGLYLILQYLVVLAGTAYFLFTIKELTFINALFALLILLSVMSLGLLFDHNKKASILEPARLFLISIFVVFLAWNTPFILHISIAALLFLISSLSFFISNQKSIVLKEV